MAQGGPIEPKLAIARAEQFVKDHGVKELPVNPVAIAHSLGILVQPKPASAQGVSGMLLRVGEAYAIVYATHIDNDGFQRFSVAHELGHYLLPGHLDAVLPGNQEIHESRGGFISRDRYELEADHFAAGLLMPNPLFSQAMKRTGEGLTAVEFLADLCRTSLTATAIRYTQCTNVPVAVVMSTGGKIDYCFTSDALKDVGWLDWPRKGDPIPRSTATYEFSRDSNRVAQAERTDTAGDLQNWFGGKRTLEISEEVVGLGSYGKTLTVLTLIEDPEESDEEADLVESWTPRFRR